MNDTQPATKPRQERHTDPARRRYTDPAGQRGFLAGLSLLAQARVHQLRRARRSNRDHAQRTRRAPALDQRTALSACPQLLHGAARPGGAAACDLHRLAHAPHGGRHRRRRPLRAALAVRPHCLVVDLYLVWAVAAAAFVAIFAFDAPFPAIVAGAALVGYLGGRYAPEKFRTGGAHGKGGAFGAALIDDATPTPAHARFRWPRLLRVVVIALLL